MIEILLAAQVTMETLAPGIARAVPATAWSCNFVAADGTKFAVNGTSPEFAAGSDPNSSKFIRVQSTHSEAFTDSVGIRPGDASQWFREFHASSGYPGVPQYELNLMLRREGASIAYMTRYMSNKNQIPYEYYAVGLCSSNFAAAAPAERG